MIWSHLDPKGLGLGLSSSFPPGGVARPVRRVTRSLRALLPRMLTILSPGGWPLPPLLRGGSERVGGQQTPQGMWRQDQRGPASLSPSADFLAPKTQTLKHSVYTRARPPLGPLFHFHHLGLQQLRSLNSE